MFSGGASICSIGFTGNSFGTVLAALPLIVAAAFVVVYLSHYLTAY